MLGDAFQCKHYAVALVEDAANTNNRLVAAHSCNEVMRKHYQTSVSGTRQKILFSHMVRRNGGTLTGNSWTMLCSELVYQLSETTMGI